jgi:TetR/AcrR family transcriptional regulator, transcriptional repressor of aconitase
MPKISEDQRQARRDQIIAATWRCFSRRGIQATSMEEIIREASLSAGAVYLYYKSKDELILAAGSAAYLELRALLLPVLAKEKPLPPAAFVREVTRAITKHAQRRELDFNAIILMCWGEAQSNVKMKELIADGQVAYREALTAIVSKWQKRGDIPAKGKPANAAKVMLSLFLGFIVQSAMIGGIDPDTTAKGIESLISSQSHPRR